MIIDFHTHIFPPWVKENRDEYVKRDPCFALLYSDAKAKLVTAEELIASMDEAHVDCSVVLNIGWVSHELCVETNDYILDSISRYPNRLVGFCVIQPKAGDAALNEMERCARAGARGIGEMRSDIQDFDLRDRISMKPLIDVAVERKLILLTHSSEPVGHMYIGKGSITPDILYSFVREFPELTLVCAHWGGGLPFYALMPEVAEAMTKVFFDTAATIFLYQPRIFKQVRDIISSSKILFGSDYPLISQNRIISQIQSLDISQEDRDNILGNNAQALLSEERK
ncbi:MAG: amidohydrolase family protein [Chloroflexota bacterium]|nr:amidohydrolase family protein [Chloroflexota bacterium]